MIGTELRTDARSPDDFRRLEAAERLGAAGPGAVPLLRPLVADRNDYVRQAAKTSVYAVAREHGDLEAARLGLAAARDPNLHLRATIWRGLKSLPRQLILDAYAPPAPLAGYETDCLDRCRVPVSGGRLKCRVCVAFVATPGFERPLDMCLRSLERNGGLGGLDVACVAFMPGADDACRQVCRRHGAVCVEPLALVPPHASMKGVTYSLPRWVDADCYVSLEPDMLVLGSLREAVENVLADRADRLYAVPNLPAVQAREASLRDGGPWPPDLQAWVDGHCAGDGDDLRFLLGDRPVRVREFCNAGLFLGSGGAFRRVEAQMLSMRPFASLWIDVGHVHWRDEMVWNVAYSLAGNLAALPKSYNYEPLTELDGLRYDWEGGRYDPAGGRAEARVFHFVGATKAWMPLYMQAHGIPMREAGAADGEAPV